jgi:predicted transcriptional regulator
MRGALDFSAEVVTRVDHKIARRLGVARSTVREVLEAGGDRMATAPRRRTPKLSAGTRALAASRT